MAFSLRKNLTSILSTKRTSDDIEAIHGIRCLNAILLLFAHKSMALFFVPYVNRTEMVEVTILLINIKYHSSETRPPRAKNVPLSSFHTTQPPLRLFCTSCHANIAFTKRQFGATDSNFLILPPGAQETATSGDGSSQRLILIEKKVAKTHNNNDLDHFRRGGD